jgi:hypothetical protein
MASTYLTRTQTAGDQRQGTFSAWVKRANLGYQYLISWNTTTSGTSLGDWIRFNGERLDVIRYTGSVIYRKQTNRLFRDSSAWYHICVAFDSDQGTADNRIKIYVNGIQETSFETNTATSQNLDFNFNSNGVVACIGRNYDTEANFDGQMAHVHWIDGTQYQASDFGETDATTGIWKPKTAPSVTYGTNGFFLKFGSSGSMGTDSSGNGNDFTVNGTLTQTQDTPSNVFATFNPLTIPSSSGLTLSDGNLSLSGSSTDAGAKATLGVSSGKWYWEVKANTASSGSDRHLVATDIVRQITSATDPNSQGIWGIQSRSGSGATLNSYTNGTFSNVNTGSTGYDDNTIISVALDMDNGKLYFAKNGTWTDLAGNVGDPVAGTNPTFTGLPTDGTIILPYVENRQAGTPSSQINFGNGYFGTTAVSSAQSPSDGIGLFEYAVPSGYKALCTKSINSQEYS